MPLAQGSVESVVYASGSLVDATPHAQECEVMHLSQGALASASSTAKRMLAAHAAQAFLIHRYLQCTLSSSVVTLLAH